VGDVINGEVFGIVAWVTWPWAPNTRWNFLTQVFIVN